MSRVLHLNKNMIKLEDSMKRDLIPLKYSLHITYQKKKKKKNSSYGKFQLFALILGLSKRPITLWAHVKSLKKGSIYSYIR